MDLADTFALLDESRIRRYVDEGQEEHLLLDFKTVSKADLSDSSDRRNLAIALSGFANASGGIIVWGIVARKRGPDQPDVACEVKEIDDLPTFLSRLNEQTAMSVRPAVDGVIHRGIRGGDTRGFAATLVPESDSGPHMAMAREGRYYKRAGSAFLAMEHFEIADMFGRRRRPKLSLSLHLRAGGEMAKGSGMVEHHGKIMLVVTNEGRAAAKNLYVDVHVTRPYGIGEWGVDGNRNEGLPRIVPFSRTDVRYGGTSERVLHPGVSLELASISVFTANMPGHLPDLLVKAHVAADDLALEAQTLTLPWSEISEFVQPR
jgi:hypothetical protein